MIPPPVVAAVVAIGLALAAASGWTVRGWKCDAERLEAVARAIEQAAEQSRQDGEILTHHETRVAATQTRFRTLTREVIRYVQARPDPVDCLDADGLRLWAAANAGDDATTAAAPDYAVSTPVGASLGASHGFTLQPRGDGGALSPVPGSASWSIGLGQGALNG